MNRENLVNKTAVSAKPHEILKSHHFVQVVPHKKVCFTTTLAPLANFISSRYDQNMNPKAPGFFEQVYKVVRCIPPGQVSSYGRIAAMLGHPNAARAVGYALSALRQPNQEGYTSANVPWQRVVNSQGRISIHHREQTANRQAEILRTEGVMVDENGRIDLASHLWPGLHLVELDDVLSNR